MLRYAIQTMRRSKSRVILTGAGLTLAFAAIVFAYSIAARVDGVSSRALEYVIQDANVWVSAGPTTRLDPDRGTMVSSQPLDGELAHNVRGRGADRLYRIATGPVMIDGVSATLYADQREDGPGALVSRDLAELLGGPLELVIEKTIVPVRAVRDSLPGISLVVPYELGTQLLNTPGRVDWLVGRVPNPKLWVEDLRRIEGVEVADSLGADIESARAVVYLLEGSRSRIDPYSFRTKFSAYTYNRSLASAFGWTARAVFAVGILLALTSVSISVKERQSEVAVFSVFGFQTEFTALLLVEMLLVLLAVIPTGAALAAIALALTFPGTNVTADIFSGLAFSAFFLPVSILLAGLWGGQVVARQSDVQLVRGSK